MSRSARAISAALIILFFGAAVGAPQAPTESRIKIDPAMLLYLKECRRVVSAVGDRIWPGWDISRTPILFYRPGVQDVLINFPRMPEGFQPLTGFDPLEGETVYYRDGTTFIGIDGQNTNRDIDGVSTLVVADGVSNERQKLWGAIQGRGQDFIQKWVEAWNFLPEPPYGQMSMILHEGFHVFQATQAPDKGPNELAAIDYPLLDVRNNSLWSLEAALIRDALLAPDRAAALAKIKELVAVREERREGLDKGSIEYEDQTEYLEGLAKYIEYSFLREIRGLVPDPALFVLNGFYGYGEYPRKLLTDEFRRVKDIIAANIDLTGNRFGVGPLRFRLYSSGAALAWFLDEVAPGWKAEVFKPDVTLFGLLREAVNLSPEEAARLAAQAKKEYDSPAFEREKMDFKAEGERVLTEKTAGILETKDTLVVIDYAAQERIAGMAFTPFGVTKVGPDRVIYDLVPLMGKFAGGCEFKFAKVIPVLVDKAKKEMSFAAKTAPAVFAASKGPVLKVDEFELKGCPFEASVAGSRVRITLVK
jgi:hypothetical protein